MKALVIAGTTATGKTALAIELAKRFDGELISADSRQLYRGLRVLSGQDVPEGTPGQIRMSVPYKGSTYPLFTYPVNGVPVWLYDAVEPMQTCSISLFRALAVCALEAITKRGKLPIIVGGAGLYIDAILTPPDTIDVPVNAPLRQRLTLVPVVLLKNELREVDPEKYARMNDSDQNNPRRLVRAIEVALWKKDHPQLQPVGYEPIEGLWVGLKRDAEELKRLVSERVEKRWQGAIGEVSRLGADASVAVRTAMGVKEITAYLAGSISEQEAKERWTRNELAYAVRQLRWFKTKKHIHWFDAGERATKPMVEKLVAQWYT
jgi:tRNA dimethylallyltransferase